MSSRIIQNITRWAGPFIALLLLSVASSGAWAFGNLHRYVIIDNSDSSNFAITGSWSGGSANYITTQSSYNTPVLWGESFLYASGSGSASETASATWTLGHIVPAGSGSYAFDAFVPDSSDNSGTSVEYRIERATYSIISGCGTYTPSYTFSTVNNDNYEGRWVPIGTATLDAAYCYRLVMSNKNNSGAVLKADAIRAERLFENVVTISDMPRTASASAAGTTNITSNTNATPTIVTTLSVTCPQDGYVNVRASGEAAAVTSVAGSNFNGLAISISKNSTATDNSNVVQSSSLATFNGDANRDFINVARRDSCTASEAITYRLTAYRAQTATGTGSFVWNGRLDALYTPNATF